MPRAEDSNLLFYLSNQSVKINDMGIECAPLRFLHGYQFMWIKQETGLFLTTWVFLIPYLQAKEFCDLMFYLRPSAILPISLHVYMLAFCK